MGVTRQWIYELIERGDLRVTKIPGTARSKFTGRLMPRVLRADVERYEKNRRARRSNLKSQKGKR